MNGSVQMDIGKQQPPLSEETPPHGDDDEFLEGLRDEELPEHYSPRPDDWRKRRARGAVFPSLQPRGSQR